MIERPLLMKGPLVRATLAGLKTQTRRLVKPQPVWVDKKPGSLLAAGWSWHKRELHLDAWPDAEKFARALAPHCPYPVGTRLWVRETWCQKADPNTLHPIEGAYLYAADGAEVIKVDGDDFRVWRKDGTAASPWRPSIHMPREASRLTLEVTAVRVERLQDISEEDALAEGGAARWCECSLAGDRECLRGEHCEAARSDRDWFRALWESINGPGSWDLNPWVWVVEFRRLEVQP